MIAVNDRMPYAGRLSDERHEQFRAVFDYEAQPKESVDCNLCGLPFAPPDQHAYSYDRYGYNVGVAICCDLVYLNPRMTKEAYKRFYEEGMYRKLLTVHYGREIDARAIRAQQKNYAIGLSQFLAPEIQRRRLKGHLPHTLLDVGGSTGVVAGKLGRRFGVYPTILDPAVDELAMAEGERIVSTAEDFDPAGRTWDLVTMCQTVDHLLDVAGTLKKLHSCLSEHGLFFVDMVDYDVRREVKIDHPYNLTKSTMKAFLKRAGFKIIGMERSGDRAHLGFLCERSH